MAIKVTVWNEYYHEVTFKEVGEVYPKGIHGCIADFLREAGMEVRTATLPEPEWTGYISVFRRAWDYLCCTRAMAPRFSTRSAAQTPES